MTALLLATCTILAALSVSVVVLWRWRKISAANSYWMDAALPEKRQSDVFAPAILSNMFGKEDAEFLAREIPPYLVRLFNENRSAIALSLIRREQSRVNSLFKDHRQIARSATELSPAEEAKVLFDFILFHLTSAVLCFLIVLWGPSHTAMLVAWWSEVAAQLQELSDRAVPASSATAEVIRPE